MNLRLIKQEPYAIIDIKYIIWRFRNGLTGLNQSGKRAKG